MSKTLQNPKQPLKAKIKISSIPKIPVNPSFPSFNPLPLLKDGFKTRSSNKKSQVFKLFEQVKIKI